MANERRPRSDSVTAQVKAFASLARRIEWPDEVTPLPDEEQQSRALSVFSRILTARAPEDFREYDAILVAQLAQCCIQLDQVMTIINKSGWVIRAGKDGQSFTRHPLQDAVGHLTTRQLSLTRALGLSGEPSDPRTIDKNARASAAAARAGEGDDDALSLLAR